LKETFSRYGIKKPFSLPVRLAVWASVRISLQQNKTLFQKKKNFQNSPRQKQHGEKSFVEISYFSPPYVLVVDVFFFKNILK